MASSFARSAGEGFAGDLTTAAAADELFARHPQVEILVNNLGIFEPKPFEAITDADWVRFFEANVLSGARLARLYLPRMKAADWGRIIGLTSGGELGFPEEVSSGIRLTWPSSRPP